MQENEVSRLSVPTSGGDVSALGGRFTQKEVLMSGMKHIPSTPILDTEYSAHFAGLRQWYESVVPQDGKAIRLRHNACSRFFPFAKA